MEKDTYKNAVIIGNGPSAIALSYMLSGNWPYYNGSSHPIDFLQYRLSENQDKSLLEQDLAYLSEGLEGRSLNPVSVLFDVLQHPEADLGVENPSVLSWRKDNAKAINHVVLGRGIPGGSWQKMDGSTLTLSLGSWMELPNFSIHEWNLTRNRLYSVQSGLRQNRATVGTVAQYYHCYVHSKGLGSYFVNDAVVTSVSPLRYQVFDTQYENLWKIEGYTESLFQKKPFTYISPNVILATGNSDQPNKLNIEGENLPFVLHSLSDFEDLFRTKVPSVENSHVLIIGAGLSAADAVITSRFYGIAISHVFRRSVSDPDLVFNKLPQNIYPEYHKVHQMMKASKNTCYDGYNAYPSCKVHAIKPDGTVIVGSCNSDNIVSSFKVSHVLVLIGRHPDLSFITGNGLKLGVLPEAPIDAKKNPINIRLFNHESVLNPGLYAVGPIVGDNFVRFVQGGCLAAAGHIVKKLKRENT